MLQIGLLRPRTGPPTPRGRGQPWGAPEDTPPGGQRGLRTPSVSAPGASPGAPRAADAMGVRRRLLRDLLSSLKYIKNLTELRTTKMGT